ncbi:uncharacterized protein LOC123363228 [Mauremys mutica]|uniref:uncharacterized protein LOC123363228 n=1 Tax=Mauremys mutica TaxID=74926 RepID=UPI001D16EA15|nr:uncharacterized protein LOC123363228 [Mauremys mutica]
MDLYGQLCGLLVRSGARDQGKEDTAATGNCSPSLSGPAASGRTPFRRDRTNPDSIQPGPTDSSVSDTEEQKEAQKQDPGLKTLAAGVGSHCSTFCAEPPDPGTKRKASGSPRDSAPQSSTRKGQGRADLGCGNAVADGDSTHWGLSACHVITMSYVSSLAQSLACLRVMDETALRKDIGTLFPAHHSMRDTPKEERREALDSLVHLARLFLLKLLVLLFRRLNKDEEEEACGSLFILDWIVQSNISEMTHHTEKLFTDLGPILQGTSIWVREALAPFIRTTGAHGLLEKSASRPLIDFLVRQCTLTLDSTVLWPGLLLQLSPAAHGPALPLLLQTSVRVVKRMQEEGRLPLARRCGKENRGLHIRDAEELWYRDGLQDTKCLGYRNMARVGGEEDITEKVMAHLFHIWCLQPVLMALQGLCPMGHL